MKLSMIVLAGLLAALATELIAAIWLGSAPNHWPMVENYWLFTALPAVAVVVVLFTALLWGLFRRHAPRYPLVFSSAYLITLAVELYLFKNPLQDILTFVLLVLLVCLFVFGSTGLLRRR